MRSVTPIETQISSKKAFTLRNFPTFIRNNYLGISGGLILLLLVFTAILAPRISPYDPNDQDIRQRLKPPSWIEGGSPEHLLGTDHLGRDLLSRLYYGARVSLLVGVAGVVFAASLGIIFGLVSGYMGNPFESVIMGWTDVQLALPFVLLALVMVTIFGASLSMVIILLVISRWVIFARVTQGKVLSAKEKEFIWAAKSIGASNYRILARHILPNIISPIIIGGAIQVGRMILIEASLSFLGLGIPPSVPSWGGMLGNGRPYLAIAPWVATFPGLAIVITVLGINLIGDWLRQHLDPTQRRA